MNFNSDNGIFELSENLYLSPYMRKKEILAQNVVWEEWYPRINGVVFNYRAVVDIKSIHGHEKITVIINFNGTSLENASLKSWLCAPTHKFSGQQNRPEGKLTKALRAWFSSRTTIILPVSADWGNIDAAYDPHNQTAEIICHYIQ